MVQNKSTPDLIATGGRENDLKIWQLKSMDKPTFVAKNVSTIRSFRLVLLFVCIHYPSWSALSDINELRLVINTRSDFNVVF